MAETTCNDTIVCKICRQEKKPARSHIIPLSFLDQVREHPGSMLLSASSTTLRTKRAPIGAYDSRILCIECESRFSDLDNYAYQVMVKNATEHFKPLPMNARGNWASHFNNIDKIKLARFFVSVLWRASVSKIDECTGVALGPYQEGALEAALGQRDAAFYPTILGEYYNVPGKGFILFPSRSNFLGVNCYKVGYGRFFAITKFDQRAFPYPTSDGTLPDGKLDVVIPVDYEKSRTPTQLGRLKQRIKATRWPSR